MLGDFGISFGFETLNLSKKTVCVRKRSTAIKYSRGLYLLCVFRNHVFILIVSVWSELSKSIKMCVICMYRSFFFHRSKNSLLASGLVHNLHAGIKLKDPGPYFPNSLFT